MGGLGLVSRRRAIASSPTAGKGYIKFADAEVLRLLMNAGVSSDGVGITKEDAARLTSLGPIFKNNNIIETFLELDYFLNVKRLIDYEFSYCSNLRILGCSNIELVSKRCFDNSGIEELILDNIVELGGSALYGMKKLTKVVLGENLSIIKDGNFWSMDTTTNKDVLIYATTPPVVEGDNQPGWYKVTFYVPDESLESYKAAARWSSWANMIKPLSEYSR